MKNPTDSRVLVADIGGTHCRIALARREAGRIRLEQVSVMPTPSGAFGQTVRDYLAGTDCPCPAAIGVAAAGRVRRVAGGSRIALTNTSLVLDREELEALINGPAWLANDLAAVAAALPHLSDADRQAFGAPRPVVAGRCLVIGVGTGLGAALLTEHGEVVDTEAGHADLAAVSPEECEWLARLSIQGRVSAEHVLCGSGLIRLHEVVSGERSASVPALLECSARGDANARRTLAGFSTWLGRVAGNLVLNLGAWGGVSLIGGVVSGLGEALDPHAFRQGFEDKAPFEADLKAVPVHRIVHPQPALLGMAGLALESLRGGSERGDSVHGDYA